MTYAIIETGGKQLWAEPGRFYDVELMDVPPDTQLEITEVLLVNHDGELSIGHPYVVDAVVKARVLMHRKSRKVIVYKMRPKKKTRKKNGHRQNLTRLLIEAIQLGDTVVSGAVASETTSPETSPEMVEV
ncbi:MAG: 50S ribosomal protein L21 [Cyanobacteriota bacterium]|nr:50S ribosomal protein L21 [Cyanobacteriota bacterium]